MLVQNYRILAIALLIGLLSRSPTTFSAGHYPVGVEGIKSATIPGPGHYYKNYNILYKSDKLKNSSGDTLKNNFDLSFFSSAHRYVHVTEKKLLGGDYFWNIAVPIIYTDIEVGNNKDSGTAIGDVFFEPFGLAWHGSNYDLVTAATVYLPVGASSKLADPGKDYYTFMLTGGGTYYFDDTKNLSFSLTARYETHTKQDGTDITPGDDFHFEWGLGKSSGLWNYGISGYAQWQVTDDNNKSAPQLEGVHDRVLAIGPEVSRYFPSQKILINFKAHSEFSAIDSPEGNKAMLTFTKIF